MSEAETGTATFATRMWGFLRPYRWQTVLMPLTMIRYAYVCFILAVALSVAGFVHGQTQGVVAVVIETEFGVIEANIDSAKAPVTATNFLKYVDAGRYAGASFSRTVTPNNQPNDAVKIEVIQARLNSENNRKGFPAIPLERTSTTGILHKDGTLSMARGGPDSATSSFFICVGDQPPLDFAGKRNADGQGFAAFGQVTKGMEIVRKIQTSPAEAQNLTPPIRIINIRRRTP